MKELLFLATIHGLLVSVQTINGVIWNKKEGNFVPIFDIPVFATARQEFLAQSRELETHNFQGETIKLTYFKEVNIIESYAQNTKVTGVLGEVWTTLSECLNFTLKPVCIEGLDIGTSMPNTSFSGLLGMIQRNETDAIPKVGTFSKRLLATQLTIPLWKTSHRLYIRRETTYNPGWIIKLFSWKVWCAILLTYFLLNFCGIVSQIIFSKIRNKKMKTSIDDHLFYNFGMICNQSHIPSIFHGRSRMLELWLGLFACLIHTAFCALLIGHMTHKIVAPPFTDLNSLLDDTSYKVVALSGSLPSIAFQKSTNPHIRRLTSMNRGITVSTIEELYAKGCSVTNNYAIFQEEDLTKAIGRQICRLSPTGIPYIETWIASGISWKFKYKRTIDMGILKLHEYGFIKMLKHQWVDSKDIVEKRQRGTEPINIDQVFLIVVTFFTSVLISLLILIIENIFSYINK